MLRRQEPSIEIDAEAARWVARIDRERLSDEETTRLDTWLSNDTRHAGAFARAQAVNILADSAAAQIGSKLHLFSARSEVPAKHRRWIVPWAIAATFVACVTLGGYLYVDYANRVFTDIGEIRRSPLADGSIITLNTASAVMPEFSNHERKIKLFFGEVLFDVAKDAQRPFIVDAGDIDVVAVGTSFVVKRLQGQPVSVMVREGMVEVRTKQNPTVTKVSADYELALPASFDIKPQIRPIRSEEIEKTLAWQQGMISLDNTSLAYAAQEFNRYNEQHIVINDAVLAKRHITGLYSATDPQGFAKAVALSLNAKSGADHKKIWIEPSSAQ